MAIGNGIGVRWGKVSMARGPVANQAFEFTVKTDNAGTSAANQFTIPITSATPYDIETSDGHNITGATGATTLTFSAPGTYTVSITESCEGWRFANGGDRLKLMTIEKWGIFTFTTNGAFQGCGNLVANYSDAPIIATTNLSSTFAGCAKFNGYVNDWDISGVTNLGTMFFACTVFNQDLGGWDVSSVTNIGYMFNDARAFTGIGVENWNPGPITSLEFTFRRTDFQADIGHWDVSNVTSFANCFSSALNFNQDISGWTIKNTGTVNMSGMFSGGQYDGTHTFNQDISGWDTSAVTNMNTMFAYSVFNQPIGNWNVGNVTNMQNMFKSATNFNQPLNSWNVSNVTNMTSMFDGATSFNQDLSTWNTSNVTSLGNTFQSTTASSFGIANWDTSSVNNFNATFRFNTSFNEDVSGWDVTGCTSNFNDTFYGCQSFNQPIGNWNITSSVTRLSNLLYNAVSFDQDLSSWNISSVTVFNNFALNVTLSTANYDALLVAWESQAPVYSGSINFGFSRYSLGSAAETARTSLINTYGWTITDGGGIAVPFTMTVDTTLGDGLAQFTIPTTGTGYNYDVATSDGQSITGNTGNTTITFPASGTYDIEITGDFPRIYFNNGGDRLKLTDVKKWGSIAWTSFNVAFRGCNNLNVSATDVPNVSAVTDFFFAFHTCSSLSGSFDCSSWDLSSVNNIGYMFYKCQQLTDINLSSLNPAVSVYSDGVVADCSNLINITFPVSFKPTSVRYLAQLTPNLSTITNVEAWNTSAMTLCTFMFSESSFNQNIGSWDMSNVTDTQYMFQKASAFNQPIGSWNVGNVTNMKQMFNITSFNQDISSWDMSSVTSIDAMLGNNSAFNQPIGNWNTSNISNFGFALYNADAFDQSLANWNILNMTTAGQFMNLSTGLSTSNYDATLVSWEAQLQAAYPGGVGYTPVISIHFGGSQYTLGSAAEAARTSLISTYGWTITDGGGVVPPYLLDTYTGASAAYSLRDLSSSTTNVVRVRRSSDNTEQDFTSTQVTDGTLEAFVGAGNDGFVTIWYDQSGNGRNTIQATPALQPQIVSSGALILVNGLPTVDFNNGPYLETTQSFHAVNDASFALAGLQKSGEISYGRFASTYFNDGFWLGRYAGNQSISGGWQAAASTPAVALADNTMGLMFLYRSGADSFRSVNGSTPVSQTTNSLVTTARPFIIGQSFSKNAAGTKQIYEMVLWDNNQSANQAGIESNINSYYTIY